MEQVIFRILSTNKVRALALVHRKTLTYDCFFISFAYLLFFSNYFAVLINCISRKYNQFQWWTKFWVGQHHDNHSISILMLCRFSLTSEWWPSGETHEESIQLKCDTIENCQYVTLWSEKMRQQQQRQRQRGVSNEKKKKNTWKLVIKSN